MKKRKLILILAVVGLIAVTAIAGTSYAFLKKTVNQSDNNVISTLSCLNVSMTDITSAITLQNAIAIMDAEGLKTPGYTFKLTNNCSSRVIVEMNLESLAIEAPGERMPAGALRVSLNSGDIPTNDNLNTRPTATATISGAESRNIAQFYLNSQEEKEFNLKIWIDQNATPENSIGKTFEGKVVIIANGADKCASKPSVFTNAASGTILASLNSDRYCYTSNPITTPGREISKPYENHISSTDDDYGTSYYFRGAVDNNYVEFANKCWRIVRITGDDGTNGEYNKATKLILFHDNTDSLSSNIANPCSKSGPSNSAFAKYGSNNKSSFNSTSDSNTYVGFVYGTPNGGTYASEHTPVEGHDSTILTNLKTWYDNYLRNYDSYLADTIWCNDKRLYSGTGVGTANTVYLASSRVNPASTANPTLMCGESKTDNIISKFTASASTDGGYGNAMLYTPGEGNTKTYYKIGLMTSDEGAFAGLAYNVNHGVIGPSYLQQFANSWWWMLSPTHKSGSIYNNMGTGVNLRMIDDANNNYTDGGVRPMISIKSDVHVIGSGTRTDPYRVIDKVNTHNLPSTYQEISYLQNRAGEYIDTGLSFPNGFHMVADVEILTTTAGYIVGADDINPYYRNYVYYYTKWQIGDFGVANFGTVTLGRHALDVCTIHDSINFSVDGTSLYSTNSASALRTSRNIYVFKNNSYNQSGSGQNVSPVRIYSLKLYNTSDTSQLVRDYIPCYRKSDNKLGLYDLVNSQFYPMQES